MQSRSTRKAVCLSILLLILIPTALFSQPKFRIPIHIQDSTGLARIDTTVTVFVGVHPNGTGCADLHVQYTGFTDHWDLVSFTPWNTAFAEALPPAPPFVTRIMAYMPGCGDIMQVQIKARPLIDTFVVQISPTDSFPGSIKYYSWPDPTVLQQYCDSMILTGVVAIADSADAQVRRTIRINMAKTPFYRAIAYPPSQNGGTIQTQLLVSRVYIFGPKTPAIPAPPTVTLLLPASGDTAQGLSPTLSWSPVAGIWRYHVQVSTDSTFNPDSTRSFAFNDTVSVSQTSLQVNGLRKGTVYYWSVYGVNQYGYSYPLTPLWWFRTQRVVGGVNDGPELPGSYRLGQNFPNPFNPGTEIRYELPVASPVTIRIFNVLGEEVATLVQAVQPPGSYRIRWDASGETGGVYYYRLVAGRFTEARAMLLIK